MSKITCRLCQGTAILSLLVRKSWFQVLVYSSLIRASNSCLSIPGEFYCQSQVLPPESQVLLLMTRGLDGVWHILDCPLVRETVFIMQSTMRYRCGQMGGVQAGCCPLVSCLCLVSQFVCCSGKGWDIFSCSFRALGSCLWPVPTAGRSLSVLPPSRRSFKDLWTGRWESFLEGSFHHWLCYLLPGRKVEKRLPSECKLNISLGWFKIWDFT